MNDANGGNVMNNGPSDDERPVSELMLAYARSLDALKTRGVIRSTKVLADYAEGLAVNALGLTLAAGRRSEGLRRG
jgi:hypothetical protein